MVTDKSARQFMTTGLLKEQLDELCERFEAAWKAGQPPRIEDYLAEVAPNGQAELLKQLLAVEFWHRRKHGMAALREDYRARFPSFASQIEATLARPEFQQQPDQGQATISNVAAPVDEAQESSLQNGLLEQFDEYRLLGKLGQGGMGAVYKALHTRLEKTVAIKVLPKERMENTDAKSRFQREIKALGRLNHPNLVHAYDAREIQGTTILVMEYVDGFDASALARKLGPLPIADACEIVRQAALGLQYAYQHDMVHRDIKPSNLMLNREGQVKVLDLGLARIRQDQANQQNMTSTGQMMGTADYIAPEQVRDSHSVDIRADIYSLGCTLYQLLAGRTLFSGEKYGSAFDKMMAHVQESPPSVLEFRTDVPGPLVAVIERMLAKRPDERFAVPGEVAAALAPFTSGSNLAALVSATESTASTQRPVDTSMAATDEYLSRPLTGTYANVTPAASFNPSPSGAGVAASSGSLAAEPTHDTHQRLPTVAAQPTQRRPAMLIALGVLGFLILAGVIFKLQTREGTLVVAINQPDAEVQVLDGRGEIVVDLKSGDKPIIISLDPGKHRLRVQKDGFELFTDEFTMKSAGREVIRATLRPSPVGQAFQPDGHPVGQAFQPDGRPVGQAFQPDGAPNSQPGKANLPREGTPASTSPRSGTPGRGVGGEGPASPTAPALPTGQFVPLAKSSDDLKAWRKTGSGTVTFENGGVRVENAAVTYPAPAIDLVIRVKIKVEGDVPPSARLTLRETPAGFYAAMLEDGQKVTVGMTEGDKWRELKSASVSVPRDKSLALEFSAVGDVLTVSLNGKPAVEVRDATHRSGVPGLAAANGATVFEDVEVKVLTRPSSTPGELASQSGQPGSNKISTEVRAPAKMSAETPKNYELEFDGVRSYVETPVKYDGLTPITLEAWITPHPNPWRYVISCDGPCLAFNGSLWMAEGIDAGKRDHLAATCDKGVIRVFIRGKLAGKPSEISTSAPRQPFFIGARSHVFESGTLGVTECFDGWIDEVRISKVARYTEDFTPQQRFDPDEHTIALYRFDEGSGSIAHDASKNGNHAKIHGARWIATGDVKSRLPGLIVGTPQLPDGRRWQLETVAPYGPRGLDWSPDGKWISCARGSVVRIHDAKTLAPVRFHAGHVLDVGWHTKFSPDGKWLASGSEDGTVRLWSVEKGTAGPVLRYHTAPIMGIAWSPDSKRLASAAHWGDGNVRVWKVDGTLETSWIGNGCNGYLAWSADGKWIAASSDSSVVKVWTSSGDAVAELKLDGAGVNNCSFSPDGKWAATCIYPSEQGQRYLALWSTATWQIAKRSDRNFVIGGAYDGPAWLPDSKRFFGWGDYGFGSWDIDKERWTVRYPWTGPAFSFCCDPQFNEVVLAGDDRLFRLVDLKTGKPVREFGFTTWWGIRVAVQPTDGRVALCRNDVRVLSPEGRQDWAKQELPWTTHAMWSPDGRWLALAGDDRKIRLWTPQGELGPVFEGHTDAIQAIAWHPQSQRLITGSKDGTIRSWGISGEGRVLAELEKGAAVDRLDWSPQAEQVLVQWTDATKKFHMSLFSAEGKALRELPTADAPNELAWDATGKLVAGVFGNMRCVRVWNAETAELVLDFTEEGFRPIWLAWSPDGQWLTVTPGGGDRSSLARLWKRDGTVGPTILAGWDSKVVWLNAETLAVCAAEWVDVHKMSADGQLEMVRSTRFPSRPWNRAFDAQGKQFYSWETGAIQALDLSTLEPMFTVLPLDKGRTVRVDPSGQMDTQDPEVEKEFIYYVAEPDGTTTLHTPAEFRKLMGWK